MSPRDAQIGRPLNRVDGPLKVRGEAQYAAEPKPADLSYGCVVSSTIAKGKIARIDSTKAQALEGVLLVLTHENRPHLPWFDRSYVDQDARSGSPFRVLYDAHIKYSGQPIALVVATSFELARHAASLVEVQYTVEPHNTDLRRVREQGREPKKQQQPPRSRGDADRAIQSAEVRIDAEYSSPVEHHNPLEPHASTVIW
ncbi:MAG: aromatic aldehyde oxidoreductase molybdenum-binding subunit, partial [Myxococcaceae bacterium]|nr:aromatic aldehyde oxidoreductase molybdenum-binding subunit [Myxococcaceae bacterium]